MLLHVHGSREGGLQVGCLMVFFVVDEAWWKAYLAMQLEGRSDRGMGNKWEAWLGVRDMSKGRRDVQPENGAARVKGDVYISRHVRLV